MKKIDLNGSWQFLFQEKKKLEEVNENDFVPESTICVPGCFDALPDLYCKRGTALYRKEFILEEECEEALLKIDGMGLRCRIHLDGKLLGTSCQPYLMLEFKTGSLKKGVHVITAAVDNMFDAEKVKLFRDNYDFYAYGGFYHGVSLLAYQKSSALKKVCVKPLSYEEGKVELRFLFTGEAPACPYTAKIFFDTEKEAKEYKVNMDHTLTLCVPSFRLWSPEDPQLHFVTVEVNGESVRERFGIRIIETKGAEILLNGRKIFLKGFNRHESHQDFGSSVPDMIMLKDIQHLKSLHGNMFRGAHYPQSQRFLDLCDEHGVLIWEETLGWGIGKEMLKDPEFISLQEEAAKKMAETSFNHPCVIIFAFLNENLSKSPEGGSICKRLAELLRKEDTGRLITFACSHVEEDIAMQYMDIAAYNTYPGWGIIREHEELMPMIAEYHAMLQKKICDRFGETKPVIIGEAGCCGIYGQHDEDGAQWTEEFQEEYLRETLETAKKSPCLRGVLLWQFNDAKSFHKMSEIRTKPLSQNLAGVYDIYRRRKLSANTVKEYFKEWIL